MKKVFILLAAMIFSASAFAQWKKTNFPSATVVTFLAVKDSTIFAATGGQGVFLSADSGTSWTAVNNGLTNHIVQAFAINGSNIYAGTSNNNGWGTGVFVSSNNGSSWSLLGLNQTSIYIQALAFNGSNIFAGDGYGSGILLSKDNGASWQQSNNGLPNKIIVWSLVTRNTTIFAGTNLGVYLSIDNGSSWTAMNTGLPDSSNVMALAISGSGNIFAGTLRTGVFVSTNNGTSWTTVNTGLPDSSNVMALAINGSNVFAGTNNGIYLSTNNGSSWINVSYGLTYPTYEQGDVYSLAVFNNSNILAGTYNSVWKNAGFAFITPKGKTTFCQGDSISALLDASFLTLSSDSKLFYQWLNNSVLIQGATDSSYTASSAGQYQVKVTNEHGSTFSDITPIIVDSLPTVRIAASEDAICLGSSISLSAAITSISGFTNSGSISITSSGFSTNGGSAAIASYSFPFTNSGTSASFTFSNSKGAVPKQFTRPIVTTLYFVTGYDNNGCQNTASATVTVNPLPTISASDEAFCFGLSPMLPATINSSAGFTTGGTLSISPAESTNSGSLSLSSYSFTNGGSSFSYTFTNSGSNAFPIISGSNTATYSITGTDGNGCQSTASATVTINPLPAVSALGEVICFGLSPALSATITSTAGFTTGGTLAISPAESSNKGTLSLSSYSFTNSGTSVSFTFSNSGTSALPIISGSNTATYSITGTDGNGCQNTASAKVTVNPLPTVTAEGSIICLGATPSFSTTISSPAGFNSGGTLLISSAGVTNSGSNVLSSYSFTTSGSQASFTFSNAGTNACPIISGTNTASYSITATDGYGCQNTANATITVNSPPSTPVILLKSDTLYADASTGIQWYNQEGLIANATSSFYIPKSKDNYYVVSSNDCGTAKSNTLEISGIIEINNLGNILIYPNPISNKFNIALGNLKENYIIEIMNSIGQVVLIKKVISITNSVEQVDLSGNSAGVYFVKLQTGNSTIVKKIIKQD